jgi:exoribonuclease-2
LFEAAHYFRRAGKGRFRKASAEVIAQALAAIEKKKQLLAQIDAWAHELLAGQCPQAVRDQLYKILFKPDKNAPEYKAVWSKLPAPARPRPLALVAKSRGHRLALPIPLEALCARIFPKGTGFGPMAAPALAQDLPLAQVAAFSIDDSATTEIDDALSVQGLGSGSVDFGIHIAAPALALQPGQRDRPALRAQRLSTVYMPGFEITMLPDALVQHFTLQEGRACPAVSLYVDMRRDHAGVTRQPTLPVEQVPIAHDLRHDQLEHWVTARMAAGPAMRQTRLYVLPDLQPQLAFLHRLACSAQRAARSAAR